MQPQGGTVSSGGVSRAWQGLASVLSRTDIGAATALAYCDLWFSLGAKPGCLDLTLHAWGAQLGASARAADKWLAQLERHGLVDLVDRIHGHVRLYVVAPDDVGKPRRFDGDPQRPLPGLEDVDDSDARDAPHESAALAFSPAADAEDARDALATVFIEHAPASEELVGPLRAQKSESDLSAHKSPRPDAPKSPRDMDEVEALSALVTLYRVEHSRGKPPDVGAPAARLGVGPLSAQKSESLPKSPSCAQKSDGARRVQEFKSSELRAQSSSIIKKPEELRALSSAQTSDSDLCAHKGPTPQAASPIDRVLAQGSPEAVEAYQQRRSTMIAHVLGKVPSLKASVARNAVDGVLNKLFEWRDVERILDSAAEAQVPWQWFYTCVKRKYQDARAPWPSGHRTGAR